jgi:exodeoxyribonuclease-1
LRTYLFYDIETTGLNKAFDQILHFAAIRTDIHLKELKRYELRIKLNPDVIPSPGALLTHEISLQDQSNALSEYDAIRQIHQWVNEPGTVSLGYNTLNFDDEFLRFSFYRNLLPPYTHQYANQCSRMDIYPMTVMSYLFKNQLLEWPIRNEKISLKLEELNAANQFVNGRSHDAMIDVEITLALARRFFAEQDWWQQLQSYFNKTQEQERIQHLANQYAILIEGRFGAEQKFQTPVCFLGFHHVYKNQSAWLSLDFPESQKMTPDELIKNIKNKKLAEPGFVLPLQEKFTQHLQSDRQKQMQENKEWLKKNDTIFKKITEHALTYTYPVYPNIDAQAALYINGFWSREEEHFCRLFHNATPKEKATLAGQIQNSTLTTLATRILGRNFPETLNSSQKNTYRQYIELVYTSDENQAPHDYKGNKQLTSKSAIQEIHHLRKEQLSPKQISLLDELEKYLTILCPVTF